MGESACTLCNHIFIVRVWQRVNSGGESVWRDEGNSTITGLVDLLEETLTSIASTSLYFHGLLSYVCARYRRCPTEETVSAECDVVIVQSSTDHSTLLPPLSGYTYPAARDDVRMRHPSWTPFVSGTHFLLTTATRQDRPDTLPTQTHHSRRKVGMVGCRGCVLSRNNGIARVSDPGRSVEG